MFPGLDPSKLKPETLTQLSDLMRSLPFDQLMKMQELASRAYQGQNVQAEMMAMEQSFPADFRMKMAQIVMNETSFGATISPPPQTEVHARAEVHAGSTDMDVVTARKLVLNGVQLGTISIEDAYETLFANEA
jgi:hypothetical protein